MVIIKDYKILFDTISINITSNLDDFLSLLDIFTDHKIFQQIPKYLFLSLSYLLIKTINRF